MAKVDISTVAEVMKKNSVDPKALRAIIEELNLAAQPEDGDGEKPPAVKKQFVVLVSDPEGRLPKFDFVAWVLQIPETESVATTQDRVFRGSYEYNSSKKGRLFPAKTVGEALENVPAKFFKEADLWIKTKTPVLVLKTDNAIPKEASADDDVGRKPVVAHTDESLSEMLTDAVKKSGFEAKVTVHRGGV